MSDTEATNEGGWPAADKSSDDSMSEVAEEIAREGVGKLGTNERQNYKYRKLDDILDCVGPIMARHKLAMTIECSDHKSEWRSTKAGGDMEFATLIGKFTYRYKVQTRVTTTFGRASDSADKATNKAMAFATKYAHVITFNIPVIGSDDADASGEETVAKVAQQQPGKMPQKLIEKMIAEFGTQTDIDKLRNNVSVALSMAQNEYADAAAHKTLKDAANKRLAELVAAKKQQVQA